MNFRIRIFLSLILFFWCLGIFLPYYFHIYEPLYKLFLPIKLAFSHVCHQLDYKLFVCNGKGTLVCSRCTGIYTGLFLSSLFFLFSNMMWKVKTGLLFLACIPLLLDIFFYTIKFYSYSQFAAGFSGLLLGATGFFYILQGVKILFLEIKSDKVN